MVSLQAQVNRWLNDYHFFRRHQALHYQTPEEFCATLGLTIPSDQCVYDVVSTYTRNMPQEYLNGGLPVVLVTGASYLTKMVAFATIIRASPRAGLRPQRGAFYLGDKNASIYRR